ncbi:uncharacterized protein N7479_005965 [Penicillium vulpinum]|uniref:uncharacterized protein n=1 Tax=Penicillium vulpinum TaxID=29845 RepID=UPI002549B645|nr:uncharacterized protein N7479_005965 [Penicillium vulpinum]KAJ5958815.1 hypothetical protein N7479_005965 [Penicillium vulpinum]
MSYQWSHYINSMGDCGSSPSEARHRDCIFDAMEFAWLPRQCFDPELQERFLSLREWVWYLDQAGTVPADGKLVLSGFYEELYATQEYHVFHCTYMWRKIHQALLDGSLIDGYIGDTHHTAHCERQIATFWDLNLNDTSTPVYVKYANCPKELNGLGRMGWYRMINGKKVHRDP